MDNLTAGNPVAHRVRVYYTGDDTLKEGEPLCYSFKTTKNWWGGSVSDEGAVTASVTAAEGTQNASKYMSVESPLRLSLSSDTPADGSKTITGSTTDFDTLHVGMFVAISGSDVTAGNYEITAISRSTESGVTNSTITLGNMDDATGSTADVATVIDNISGFAGVVAKGGWVGKAGPRVIDIYVPNGAIVPVRSDQNCTLGRTILAVHTNEQHLTAPYELAGKVVAIAWETVDTATTTGLVLAKLDPNMFIHQKGDVTSLLVDDEDTGDNAVNQINVNFIQTSGRATAFQIRAFASAGFPRCWDYGLAMDISADLSGAAITDSFNASGHWLNIGASTITGGSNLSALRAGVYEGGGATFTSVGSLAPLSLAVQVATDPSARLGMIYCRNDGAQAIDGFIIAESTTALAFSADTSGVNQTGAFPIIIGTTTHYIHVFSATDGATT